MVVGVDCCFSFPAWFLEEHGCGTVFEFWRKVAEGKGEEWLASGVRGCAVLGDCGEQEEWEAAGGVLRGGAAADDAGDGL